MFEFGFNELLIIAVIALMVLGPERLPKAARLVGLWVRKARAQWYSVKSELEFELAQEEMKKHAQEFEHSIKAPMLELNNEMQQTQTDIQTEFNTIADPAQALTLEAAPQATVVAEVEAEDDQNNALEQNPQQGNFW